MTRDIMVLPAIDWPFPRQRPQQFAIELGKRGHRVFYLTEAFAAADLPRPYLFWSAPAPNVYLVQLRCPEPHPNLYKSILNQAQIGALTEAIAALRSTCRIGGLVSIVDLPFWRQVARGGGDDIVVYDCMDFHAGFKNNSPRVVEEEAQLIKSADIVVTSSAPLSERVMPIRSNILIRNGCDPGHFRRDPGKPARRLSARPVVGYFGSLDHWFDTELVAQAARRYADWHFVLIGRVQDCDLGAIRKLPNVQIVGEVPYAALPEFAHGFDVCMIPFLVNELTLNTNPVKMYEYLAAGKPVVGTAMPEIEIGGEGMVYPARDRNDFIDKLAQAMAVSADPALVRWRVGFAENESWSRRVDRLEQAINAGRVVA